MKVFKTISEIKAFLKGCESIGFVPTMGALHEGHISLVKQSVSENEITVASIFVNPIQFNDKNDLKNYPRTLEKDLDMLEKSGCTVVFVPDVQEMYPSEVKESYNFGSLETVMEGACRPGHFNGVAVVVNRLFEIVNPKRAYFGKKDFQQLAIIKALVRQKHLGVEIVPCETKREQDGLAMSSRNKLLDTEHRKSAVKLSQALFFAKENFANMSNIELKNYVENFINGDPLLKLEYFEIADTINLQPIDVSESDIEKVACIAVRAGNVRLIDNIIL